MTNVEHWKAVTMTDVMRQEALGSILWFGSASSFASSASEFRKSLDDFEDLSVNEKDHWRGIAEWVLARLGWIDWELVECGN